jgi:hypothetical protein
MLPSEYVAAPRVASGVETLPESRISGTKITSGGWCEDCKKVGP